MHSIRSPLCLLLSCLVPLALAGCNLLQLFAFRAQMRDIDRHLVWVAEGEEARLVFTKPLLTAADLSALGIFPEVIDPTHAVLRYRRADTPTGGTADYDIHLQFTADRLSGMKFPRPLCDGLGQTNIRRLFARVGGQNDDAPRLEPVPKDRLLAAGLCGVVTAQRVVVALEPLDPRNCTFEIELRETDRADAFSRFRFSVTRPARR